MPHIMTVDLEEWYHGLDLPPTHQARHQSHVLEQTQKLLEILSRHHTKATFFVVAEIADTLPDVVRKVRDDGHEISSHGLSHIRYGLLTKAEILNDIQRSLEILAETVGKAPIGFRAPCFSVTEQMDWFFDVLRAWGVKYDSSVFPIKTDRYGIRNAATRPYAIQTPAGPLWEFPITVAEYRMFRVPFAGGAYFRILPLRFTRRFFKRVERKGNVVTFYIHPWEADANQPRVSTSLRLRLTRHVGLTSWCRKFEQLLDHFEFCPVGTYIERYLTLPTTAEATE